MARPPYIPTKAARRRVSIAAGGGMSHEEIAIALGIDRKTLAKHFALELTVAANERRLEVMQAMHRSAKKGNVAAQKAYLAMAPQVAAPPLPKEPKAPVKGKKQQAAEDALSAAHGTEWRGLLDETPTVQ